MNPRNASEAAALIRIADRASRITQDYRLVWNRHAARFEVVRKGEERSRRYIITESRCSCPSFEKNRTCKHHLGLVDLVQTEIHRYILLDFPEDRARMEAFAEEVASEAMWRNEAFVEEMAERYFQSRERW